MKKLFALYAYNIAKSVSNCDGSIKKEMKN